MITKVYNSPNLFFFNIYLNIIISFYNRCVCHIAQSKLHSFIIIFTLNGSLSLMGLILIRKLFFCAQVYCRVENDKCSSGKYLNNE